MNIPDNKPNYNPEPVRSGVDWKTLKIELYKCCTGLRGVKLNVLSLDIEKIIPGYMSIWKAFEKYDFNLEKFMEERGYELIEDEIDRDQLLIACLRLIKQPISKYVLDWMNGYLDFTARSNDLRWEDGSIITDEEIIRRLFFCRTEKDIWTLMGKGIGDIQDLYAWYKGIHRHTELEEWTNTTCHCERDDKKAEEMLDYLIESPDVVEPVRRLARLLQIFS